MPRPGFYNDNEYRAYPFVFKPNLPDPLLATNVIVDAGVILGLDAFTTTVADYAVWLASIERLAQSFKFTFRYAEKNYVAKPTPLVFTCPSTATDWTTIFAESVPVTVATADPIWEGFLVVGKIETLVATMTIGQTLTFEQNSYQLEPGRIQSLNRAYLRSITVANYDRPRVPNCGATTPAATNDRILVVNKGNLKGPLFFKEGYNCQITQTTRANEISISALKNAGAPIDAAFCAHGSELPLYLGESFDAETQLYSNSPTCKQVISTINGLGGKNINIVGGNSVAITTDNDNNKITVAKKANAQTNCTP